MIYNDNDPFCAEWLCELIKRGHLPAGTVDDRSIADLEPDDCGATVHFFAGIGGWPLALRLAGWPDDRPVWTGSCPCQPWSSAGTRMGAQDERHLWPKWLRLIEQCRPLVIFGEQVSGRGGLAWVECAQSDLEAIGYSVGTVDLCASLVGLPQRPRLFWVADADDTDERRQPVHAQMAVVPETPGRSPREWCEARGLVSRGYGLPGRVGRLRGYGNAIVAPVAAIFVRAYMGTLSLEP